MFQFITLGRGDDSKNNKLYSKELGSHPNNMYKKETPGEEVFEEDYPERSKSRSITPEIKSKKNNE